jgi:hypothetical protein
MYDPKDDVIQILAKWAGVDISNDKGIIASGCRDILNENPNSYVAAHARYLADCQWIWKINRNKLRKKHLPNPNREDYDVDVTITD